ncbi:MAG: type II toxin-antitoxin system RelE/ParE family toxin [Gammaproteobacteria bacterium]|nr:type II toxin-antitoxin system RelE/ParE family toxin [Gammaproteobacteria bacterium]
MSGKKKNYILTETAERDFRQTKQWSLSRWGKKLTTQYFKDLHQAAQYIALNYQSLPEKDYLTGTTELGIYAVREHYLIYVPVSKTQIVIVGLIRQTRDVPAIIKENNYLFRRELKKIQKSVEKGKIKFE